MRSQNEFPPKIVVRSQHRPGHQLPSCKFPLDRSRSAMAFEKIASQSRNVSDHMMTAHPRLTAALEPRPLEVSRPAAYSQCLARYRPNFSARMAQCSECSDRGTARGSHPIVPSRHLQYETPNEIFSGESDFHRRTLRRQPAMGFSHSKYAITAASPGVREASAIYLHVGPRHPRLDMYLTTRYI